MLGEFLGRAEVDAQLGRRSLGLGVDVLVVACRDRRPLGRHQGDPVQQPSGLLLTGGSDACGVRTVGAVLPAADRDNSQAHDGGQGQRRGDEKQTAADGGRGRGGRSPGLLGAGLVLAGDVLHQMFPQYAVAVLSEHRTARRGQQLGQLVLVEGLFAA
ncbi:hypothetical protein ACIO13_16945 [Streptomyces sp. NPDC087425]|uniref:hypothetical protein n=1 Tax=Streptomyces sp. NPDC087425 TaxID=3365787 RepID=UPI0037FACA30